MKTHLSGTVMLLLCGAASTHAHHSYSMFDDSDGTRSVSGTIAKLEWKNPHVFIWLHVPDGTAPGKSSPWGFENASPSVLAKLGWNKLSLQPGDKVTVDYWPLRGGGSGGHCVRVKLAGRLLHCASNLGGRR